MDIAGDDWRAQLQPVERSRVVTKMKEALRKHLPVPVPEELDLSQLQSIAARFEEKIYNAATNKCDYFRKMSLNVLCLENQANIRQIPEITQAIPNQNSPATAPGLPATGTNPAPSSSICLVSQEQTLQQALIQPNTPATLQATSLPSLSHSSPVVSDTSMLQNIAGMEETSMIEGSVQDICVAQRQLGGENQHEQQQQRLKMLMEQQKLLMQLQQVDSRISQHHGCHNRQIPQASIPSMGTGMQSSIAAGVQYLPAPQVTYYIGIPITHKNIANVPQAGFNSDATQGINFSPVQHGSVSDVFQRGKIDKSMKGALNPELQPYGNILSHNSTSTVQPNNAIQANATTLQQQKHKQKQLELMNRQQEFMKRHMHLNQCQLVPQQPMQRQQQAQVLMVVKRDSTTDVDEQKVGQESTSQKLQVLSPHISHHSIGQQQSLLPSHLNITNPLHSENSPVIPPPSPFAAPCPIPLVINTWQAGHQHTSLAPETLSIAVEKPGSGASQLPLLAELKSTDGSQTKVHSRVPNKSGEKPLDRLLKKYIYFTVKLLAASAVFVALLLIAYKEGRHKCRA